MNLASLLANAVFPKLFHGWVRIQSLKSSNEHIEWNKPEAFGSLPCRARGGGKAPVSLGQGLILRYRFGISNIAYEEVLQPSLSLTPACPAAGPWAVHSSYMLSAVGIRFNAMQDIAHCSTRSWEDTRNPEHQEVQLNNLCHKANAQSWASGHSHSATH